MRSHGLIILAYSAKLWTGAKCGSNISHHFDIFWDNDVNGDDNNEDVEKVNDDSSIDDDNEEINRTNDEDGMKENDNIKINEEDSQAAINFVKTSIQHSLYVSGRG